MLIELWRKVPGYRLRERSLRDLRKRLRPGRGLRDGVR
jgi:hypothetical protein